MNKNHIQKSIIFVVVGLLFLPLIANAGWLSDVIGLDDMANSILSALLGIITTLVAGIPAAALSFLNWVAGPDFLQISMTNSGLSSVDPRYNALVGTGWEITRNLANVALIFGLVVIAINIILGSQEVQAKKSLINFVLIAILINFTPVICGFIIDASNSLTYYFMQEGVRGDLVNFLKESIQESQNMDFAALIVFFFFGIFSAVMYLLYALLFAARYVILWILIILSPIAFASKVFPKSRYITKVFPSFCYWDEWWDQFIQWNVIGIPAGFFIYLSNVAMVELTAGGVFADSSGISVFGQLFSYAMPFIFMVIGFFTTMSSGGAVGAKISGVGKQIWSKTGTAVAGAGAGYVAGRAKALGTYAKEGSIGLGVGALNNYMGLSGKEKLNWKTREGRDEARQKYKEFKTGVKEKAAGYGLISHETAYQKSKEEKKAEEIVKDMDLDYFNKHQGDASMSFEIRKAGDKKFMKDPSAYLKGAGNNAKEYQRRMKAFHTYGDNSKAHKKIETRALMDANFKNTNLAGETDWGQLYDINLDEEMKKLSAQELLENASEGFLENEDNLEKLSIGQLNYILNRGSKTQVAAIENTGKNYKNNKENKKRIKLQVSALKKAIEDTKKNIQDCKTQGRHGDLENYTTQLKKFEAELEKIERFIRVFAKQ